jgi:hypothetical protein
VLTRPFSPMRTIVESGTFSPLPSEPSEPSSEKKTTRRAIETTNNKVESRSLRRNFQIGPKTVPSRSRPAAKKGLLFCLEASRGLDKVSGRRVGHLARQDRGLAGS